MQGDLFSEPVRQPYARGSHTSWKAAHAVDQGERATKTRRYLALLAEHGSLTDPETEALTGWPRSSICSIRFSVENALLVTKTGEVRPSMYGRDCAAYRLTAEGEAVHQTSRS